MACAGAAGKESASCRPTPEPETLIALTRAHVTTRHISWVSAPTISARHPGSVPSNPPSSSPPCRPSSPSWQHVSPLWISALSSFRPFFSCPVILPQQPSWLFKRFIFATSNHGTAIYSILESSHIACLSNRVKLCFLRNRVKLCFLRNRIRLCFLRNRSCVPSFLDSE